MNFNNGDKIVAVSGYEKGRYGEILEQINTLGYDEYYRVLFEDDEEYSTKHAEALRLISPVNKLIRWLKS